MFIKAPVLRAVAAVIFAVMILFAGVSVGGTYNVKDPASCRLSFAVLSDSHVEGNNFARYRVFTRVLQDVKKNESGNDAVVFLGDNTMNGNVGESLLFHGAVRGVLKNETIFPVQGNHDIGNGQGDYEQLKNRWYTYTEAFFGKKLSTPYHYEVIEGFYFIAIGTEAQTVHEMVMSEAQFSWLEEVLTKAAESGRPVFVFSHFPTDYASDEEGAATDRLIDMLADYNRTHDLFCFVGHMHMPLHLSWSFQTYYGFPEIYLPCLTRLTGEKDNELLDDTGDGLEVEVYENEVVVRGRNFYRGEWKYETADETLCEVAYTLKNPVTLH